MPASCYRSIHAALIPWVIALVVLIGLNAIAPDYSRARKSDSTGEAGITQPVDIPPAPGNFANPLVFLISHSTCRAAILTSRVLCIEIFREEPLIESMRGAVRGRAPPAGFFA